MRASAWSGRDVYAAQEKADCVFEKLLKVGAVYELVETGHVRREEDEHVSELSTRVSEGRLSRSGSGHAHEQFQRYL